MTCRPNRLLLGIHVLWVVLGLVLVPCITRAGDGVIEINQACALRGCFPGDAPGFPVTIEPGVGHSFELTSDLVVGNAGRVIEVHEEDVGLDLGGFTIRGSHVPGAGCSDGIAVRSAFRRFSVKNGTLLDLAGGALAGNRVEDVRVIGNCQSGFSGSDGSFVTRSIVSQNGGVAVATSDCPSSFLDCSSGQLRSLVAERNGGAGMDGQIYGFATISGSIANSNFQIPTTDFYRGSIDGFDLSIGNLASGNGAAGITPAAGGLTLESSATGNALGGIVSEPFFGQGLITTTGSSLARGNTANGRPDLETRAIGTNYSGGGLQTPQE